MTKIAYYFPAKLVKYLITVIIGLIFYLLFVAVFSRGPADYDLWGYLSFGRAFWEEGFFPYRDVFAYTPTKPLWIYHEWLTGVVLFGLVHYLGPASLQFLRYIFIILTIYIIYVVAVQRGAKPSYAIIVLFPAILLISFGYFPVRAQIFTFFFFILTLYVLESFKKTGDVKLLRWLPLIQIFWCNFHGGYVAGLGLIFLYALGEGLAGRKISLSYLKWGIVASLATLMNPYGIKYWIYTFQAVSMPRPEITEWYSVFTALKFNIHIFPVTLFLVFSLITLLLIFVRGKKDWTEIFVIAVLIYLGSTHIRHNILFGLIFGAYVPLYLSECVSENKYIIFKRLAGFFIFTLSLVPVMTYFYLYPVKQISFIPTFKLFVSADLYPVKALDWLKKNHIKGNILPHFEWGEYLMWSCYPDCRVAMDGRYENVYQDNVHKEYFDFLYGRDQWRVFLKKYPHDIALLRNGTRIQSLMNLEQNWRAVYMDQTSIIFVRNNSTDQ